MKRSGYVPLILAVLFVLFPKISITAAKEGLDVWAGAVFPSLFPFAVLSSMLVSLGMLKWIGRLFYPMTAHMHLPMASSQAIVAGMLSGYPVGAMLTRNLYIDKKISRNDVELTALASSVCSPMFIIGTLGTGMLQSTGAGVTVLAANYLSYAIIIYIYGVIWKKKCKNEVYSRHKDDNNDDIGFVTALKRSVDGAASALISVCGYIVLFFVITGLIECIHLPEGVVTVLSAVLEISGGCAKISGAELSMSVKTALSAFAASWGGVCVLMQISGFISDCGVKSGSFFLLKLIHGLLSALIAFIAARWFIFA